MQVVREITEDEDISDVEYSTFEAEENSGSVQHLQREMQSEVFATLHLRSVEEEAPHQKCYSCAKCTKIFVQVVLVTLVWMAVCVPSVIYAKVLLTKNESNTTDSPRTSNNSFAQYTGQVCKAELSSMQNCLDDILNSQTTDSNAIRISPTVNQSQNEGTVKLLQRYEPMIQNHQCRAVLRPFACLYFFPLVSCDDDEENCTEVGPTQQRCEMIRDDVCRTPWMLLKMFNPNLLPRCQDFSSSSPDLLNSSCIANLTFSSNNSQINCSTHFVSLNGTCVPECQVWSPYTISQVKLTDILVVSTASFALLISTCVLVLGCLRCRKIFTYPSIFAIYQTIPLMILAVLVVIGFIWRRQLFCSSPNLVTAYDQPSNFCLATGLAFHYFITQLPFWWTCHVIAVFLNTLFPYQMRRMECSKRLRCLHVFMVAAGILLPMASMATVTAHGGYILGRVPTFLCVGGNRNIVFSVTVVPITIAIGVGSTLMIFILSTVIKRHVQAHMHHLRVRLDWTAEAKVFTALFYFLILGITMITILTKSLAEVETFVVNAADYFLCEASGVPNGLEVNNTVSPLCKAERESLGRITEPVGTTIAMMLLGLYPIVYLVYIINIRELKETWCTRTVRAVEPSQKTATASRKKKKTVPDTYAPLGSNRDHPSYYTKVGDTSNVVPTSFPGLGEDAYTRPSTFTPPAI